MNTAPPPLNDLAARIAHLHRELSEETDPCRRVSILNELSFHLLLIDIPQSGACAKEMLRISTSIRNNHWIARSCVRLGDYARRESRYPRALRYYSRAWQLLNELPDSLSLKAYIRRNEGNIYYEMGKLPDALSVYDSALELAQCSGSQREIAATLGMMSCVCTDIGLYGKSLMLLREAMKIFEVRGFLSGMAGALVEVGRIYALLEDWEPAFEHCNKGIELHRQVGNKLTQAQGYLDLGAMHTTRRQFDEALCAYDKALSLTEEAGSTFMHAGVCKDIAHIYIQQHNYARAWSYLEKAQALFSSISNEIGTAGVLLEKGELFILRKKWQKGINVLSEACVIVTGAQLHASQLRLHKLLARAYEENGNFQEAIAHYKLFIESEEIVLRNEVQRELIAYQLQNITEEKEGHRARADQLEREVDNRSKELASLALRIARNDELLDQLRRRLADLKRTDRSAVDAVNKILQEINERTDRIDAWNAFGQQLQKLDRNFLHNLTEAVPSLTPSELRICSLLRLNLCNKEIAGLLSISGRTIDGHRRNIRKKMGLKEGESLVAALARI